MKIKRYKLLTLLGVGLITSSSSALSLLDANAALTAPATYNYSYTYDGLFTFELNTSPNYVYYTRTADGAYYNYTNTTTITTGLEVTQTFNRSNTSWSFVSGSPGGYTPTDTKIGADSTVGTVKKFILEIDNQTSHEYYLYIDFSSTGGASRYIENLYDGEVSVADGNDLTWISGSSWLARFYVPSYKILTISSYTGGINYFDAWYLKDLGLTAAYEAGLDDGYVVGQDDADLLVTGFSAMVGILVNFVLMIANLEVLGVSLMGILTVIILFAGIIWTLKLIRG